MNTEPSPPSPEDLAFAKEKAEQLEAVARRLGLHWQASQLLGSVDEDGDIQMTLVTNFVPGDLAWREETLNPDAKRMSDEFAEIQKNFEVDEFLAYRKRLAAELEKKEGTE